MENKPLEKPSDPQPIPAFIIPRTELVDEISLFDLWQVIVKRKWIIILCVLVAMASSFVYIFFAVPTYQAKTHLLPPLKQDIQGLLIDYRGGDKVEKELYTQDYVYMKLLNNLKSQGLRREFFDVKELVNHYGPEKQNSKINIDEIFDNQFNNNLVILNDKIDPSFVTVTLNLSNANLAAQWLGEFIDFANKRTINQLSNDIEVSVKAKLKQVRFQLDSKRALAKQQRHDRIVNIQEALRIAEMLGINDRTVHLEEPGKSKAEVAVNTAQMPLYMQGTKALEAEIFVLESRKSDDSFIKGLRDLQGKLTYLEGVKINPEKLSMVTIDSAARVPYRANNPRKIRIILFGVLFGIVASVLCIFLLEFVSKIRKEFERNSV